jgi:glycosyltransferase involved in cell wall biosynthesis
VLSVVIPAFNEEVCLPENLAKACAALERGSEPFEIVVVDDGSKDATAAVVERAGRSDPRIRLVRLPVNRGKGAAVREGALQAQGDFVFFLDADLSTAPEEIERFLPPLRNGAPVVLGSRRMEGARILRRQSALREWMGKVFTRLARWLAAPGVSDFTCGFKGFSASAAREIFSRLTVERWAFDAEIVAIARARGIRVREIPVAWTNDPGTRVRMARDAVVSFLDLLRIARARLSGRYRE